MVLVRGTAVTTIASFAIVAFCNEKKRNGKKMFFCFQLALIADTEAVIISRRRIREPKSNCLCLNLKLQKLRDAIYFFKP